MIFAQTLEIVALSDLASVLCARKFSFAPWGDIFAENQVFGHFLQNRASDLSKTWSETGYNCFELTNGSVVSGKILVLAVLALFGSKIHCTWRQNGVFGGFFANFFQSVDVVWSSFVI